MSLWVIFKYSLGHKCMHIFFYFLGNRNPPSTYETVSVLSSHLRRGLPKVLFPLGLPSKSWRISGLFQYRTYIYSVCSARLSHLDLRFLIMLGEEYNACSSALCNFLHSPVISSLLAPNIFLNTLFSSNLNLCSSPCSSSLGVGRRVNKPSS